MIRRNLRLINEKVIKRQKHFVILDGLLSDLRRLAVGFCKYPHSAVLAHHVDNFLGFFSNIDRVSRRPCL